MSSLDTAIPGIVVQACGILLLAILSAFLERSARRDHMRYWSAGWAFLASSLVALILCSGMGAAGTWLRAVYYLGHYAFAYQLWRGCRAYAWSRAEPGRNLLLLPGALAALGLAVAPAPAELHHGLHMSVMTVACALSLRTLWPLRRGPRSGPALRILLSALALLTFQFLAQAGVATWLLARGLDAAPAYAVYASGVSLLTQFLLGFGMVTLAMEDTNRQLQGAVRELRAAKERLELVARVDPLTDSLNRHALHSVIEEQRRSAGVGGSVAVVDVDDLKGLNDTHGHAAGDAAIRAVARAIRALVRADDLVFRWGGDEFLLLLFGLAEEDTRNRLAGVNAALCGTRLPGVERPVDLSVSVGVAPILPGVGLDRAIELADSAMYSRKHARRAALRV
jgi:diguanylate cyclase (GGDEF)-like protein